MDMSKGRTQLRWLSALIMLALVMPVLPSSPANAQAGSRLFPETGKTVKGKFLVYWDTHGGLAQQGFPISEEIQEKSETDGKTYTVQYFERAVFEMHPENPAPNDVLLSLLGNFLYKKKYTSNAPGQQVNTDLIFQDFRETSKRVGGKFLQYWRTHGGLAQQGFPISEEFTEVSPLDGKPYRVQYFERAVFELHPEFKGTPNEVLLSQLGRFRFDEVYKPGGQPTPGGTQPTPTTRPGNPTPPPAATNTPAPANPCADVPPSQNMLIGVVENNTITRLSNCERAGTTFAFLGDGFQPGESIGVYFTAPDQSVYGAPFQVEADAEGFSEGVTLSTTPGLTPGIYAASMEGTTTHRKAIGYFKVLKP